MLAESYLHQLNPFIFQLNESIGLRWYGTAYIAGFIVAWSLIRWMGNKRITPIRPDGAGDLIFASAFGVVIGGRVGFGLFYSPSIFYTFTDTFPWWELLAVHHGGMSSHGGILGVLVALCIWGRKNKIPMLHLLDIGAFCAIPGLFFGRLANFVNAELWGRRLPEAMQPDPPWWSIKYPTEVVDVWLQQPLTHGQQLDAVEPLRTTVAGGTSFHSNIVSYMYAGDLHIIELVRPLLTAYYPSQIFQAITDGPILLLSLLIVWWRPRRQGVVAGWFLIVYGSLRVLTEYYRQPDVGVDAIIGLSRGQLLSAAMCVIGVLLLFICSSRDTQVFGGFGTKKQ